MMDDLKGPRRLVGLKQSTEAVSGGIAEKAYVALDADDSVKVPFVELCGEHLVPVEYIESKKELGRLCGINVSAACAVLRLPGYED